MVQDLSLLLSFSGLQVKLSCPLLVDPSTLARAAAAGFPNTPDLPSAAREVDTSWLKRAKSIPKSANLYFSYMSSSAATVLVTFWSLKFSCSTYGDDLASAPSST